MFTNTGGITTMRRIAAVGALCLAAVFGAVAFAPAGGGVLDTGSSPFAVSAADAAPAKKPSGGNSNSRGKADVDQAGQKIADLFAGWMGPLLMIAAAVGSTVFFVQRNMGMGVAFLAACCLVGSFVFAPEQVESAWKGVYDVVLG